LKSSLGSKLKRIELPKTMLMEVVIELDDELYASLAKNPSWLQKIQTAAAAKARSAMDDVEKQILQAEAKAQNFDPKVAAAFTRDVQVLLEKGAKAASDDMADACEKLITDYKKGQKELLKFRVKCSGKIALTSVLVTGGVVLSVTTFGGLTPLGIVGIVKGGLAIGQEIVKLALDADKAGKLIQAELTVLKKLMNEENAKAKTSGKVAQGAKEIGLNVFSKVLGVETPSLKNCQSHIEVHKVDIAKIEKKSKDLSKTIYEAMDEQAKQAKALTVAKKTLPANKVGKISIQVDKVEKVLDELLKSTINLNESIERAEKRQEQFEKALDAMKDGIPGWVKWVDVAVGLSVDLATGITDASSALEKAVSGVSSAIQAIGNETIDLV
jgi:chaperonin cofactor prefoldin